ncbi:crossover junction endodeoxyribonuclease RuvC [Candidatus Uhrbacteria bacterium]|nr:crossover junction endodeoxyribonuclease RuvC [Candidatus Uhrbacteria bacterium]
MRILGIDPGLDRLGWAVVEHSPREDRWVASGCIRTMRGDSQTDRLLSAGKQLQAVFAEYKPDRVGVEQLFFAKNAKTAMMVGQARGVILYVVASQSVPIIEVLPNQVKQSVAGSGAADKRQVGKMVRLITKDLPTGKRLDDEVDAIAIALTAAQLQSTNRSE